MSRRSIMVRLFIENNGTDHRNGGGICGSESICLIFKMPQNHAFDGDSRGGNRLPAR